jgi:hypothetical protein
MIWHAIFNFFYTVAQYVIGLLPDMTDADLTNVSNITGAFQSVRGYLMTANQFFPVDLAFTVLGVIISFEIALALWKLIRWVGSIISVGIIK